MKLNTYICFPILFALISIFSNCNKTLAQKENKQKTKGEVNQIAFYNVENLFDTQNDPATEDEQFLPKSEKKWTPKRYRTKLENIYKVLDSLDNQTYTLPALVGLAEVENDRVLQDLIAQVPSKTSNYDFIHRDSPDVRGIDVALLYDNRIFTPSDQEFLRVDFDHLPDETTRDILYAKGKFKKEQLHIFVTHWSSRRGGVKKSEPKRIACAKVVRTKLDAIFAKEPNAKIVIMGDFNDETQNRSVTEILRVKNDANDLNKSDLYNTSYPLDEAGKGTYNYRGKWNMLDQIIVSEALLQSKKGLRTVDQQAKIYQEKWICYYDKKKKQSVPSRTYGGPNYYGGYSDHFPTFLTIAY